MQIPESVAEANDIERAGDVALIMITLQKPSRDAPLHAIAADVTGTARDLLGNKTRLDFRRVESANSVYSLASLPIEDDDTLTFTLNVEAASGEAVVPVEFNQTFYTE